MNVEERDDGSRHFLQQSGAHAQRGLAIALELSARAHRSLQAFGMHAQRRATLGRRRCSVDRFNPFHQMRQDARIVGGGVPDLCERCIQQIDKRLSACDHAQPAVETAMGVRNSPRRDVQHDRGEIFDAGDRGGHVVDAG